MALGAGHSTSAANVGRKIYGWILRHVAIPAMSALVFAGLGFYFETEADSDKEQDKTEDN